MRRHLAALLFAASTSCINVCSAYEESEPNSLHQANPVECGDTVTCAMITPHNDTDCFQFNVLGPDSIFIETWNCSTSVNTFIILYNEGDSIVATNDDGGPEWCSEIRYRALGPGSYTVCVYRQTNVPDSLYSLTVTCTNPPPEDYDFCSTPRLIDALPYYNEGSTYGATHQAGSASPDVFYKFYNPATASYTITVCCNLWDARVQILGLCLGAYGDDANEGCTLGAVLNTFALPVGEYWIMVEGTAANQQGDFSIEVDAFLPPCPPPERLVLGRVGGLPFLDWPQVDGVSLFIVWNSNSPDGVYEHLGVTPQTFFTDSSGFTSPRRFYRVTSFCPW